MMNFKPNRSLWRYTGGSRFSNHSTPGERGQNVGRRKGRGMSEVLVGKLLLALTLLLVAAYLLAAVLTRIRIPGILGALREPMAVIGFFSNPWVLLAWTVTVGLQVCAVYVPFLQDALHTVPLDWADWGLIFGMAVPIFVMTEVWKTLRMRSARGSQGLPR